MAKISKNYDVIIIFGGGLIQEKSGIWRTTTFDDKGDNYGICGDRLRVETAYYLFLDNPESVVVASGGRGQYSNITGAPTISSVIKKELIELGVPQEKIIEEDKAGNTFEELVELEEIIKKFGWKNAAFVSNEWHLPRIQAMVQFNSELHGYSDIKFELVSAEKVAILHDEKKWKDIITHAYSSEQMEKRKDQEAQGISQIKNGSYRYT